MCYTSQMMLLISQQTNSHILNVVYFLFPKAPSLKIIWIVIIVFTMFKMYFELKKTLVMDFLDLPHCFKAEIIISHTK